MGIRKLIRRSRIAPGRLSRWHIPAKAILKRDIYYTYACENCKKNDISTPIVKTPKDAVLIPGSYASPEAVAYIAVQKFVMGSPLYRQEQDLNNYLLDGRIELSNNRAERSIKPFVISRKNFLFANTARGAQSSAVLFSLIETAKENELDPYRYLTWVFAEAPRLSHADPEWASKLLPWNAPATCRPVQ